MYRLTIAQHAYSSWSMRAWLLLRPFELAVETRLVRLYTPEFAAFQAEVAPGRTVPLLTWEEAGRTHRVWDSLAIAETLAERHPGLGIWPEDPTHRRIARIVAAEMHAGFGAIRTHCPMNFHRVPRKPRTGEAEARADAERATALWAWALAETGGPWLGGPQFSAADAFMAPLASRLVSYDMVPDGAGPYAERVLSHPASAEWIAEAHADPERIAHYDEA
ncbi:MAG: glutathione S-transferase N-terminal domain-containing protein [Pseudomonadota bacterium]